MVFWFLMTIIVILINNIRKNIIFKYVNNDIYVDYIWYPMIFIKVSKH